jgi:hypothetical protein
MTFCPNFWMLDLVVLMLVLQPLKPVTASIADDVGQRGVDLDAGCHMGTIFGRFAAVSQPQFS